MIDNDTITEIIYRLPLSNGKEEIGILHGIIKSLLKDRTRLTIEVQTAFNRPEYKNCAHEPINIRSLSEDLTFWCVRCNRSMGADRNLDDLPKVGHIKHISKYMRGDSYCCPDCA